MQLLVKHDATNAQSNSVEAETRQQMPPLTSKIASSGCLSDFTSGYVQCLVDTMRYVGHLNTMAGRLSTRSIEEDATIDFCQTADFDSSSTPHRTRVAASISANGLADSRRRLSPSRRSRQRYQISTPANGAVRRHNRSGADSDVARGQVVSRRRRTRSCRCWNDGSSKDVRRQDGLSASEPTAVCFYEIACDAFEISRGVDESESICISPRSAAVTSSSDDIQVRCADFELSNDPSHGCNTSACVGQPPSLLAETAAINFTSGCARNVRAVPRNAANDDDDGGCDGSHVYGDDELMRRQRTSISCDERLRSGFGSDSRCVCRNCSSTVAHRRRTDTCEDEQLEIDEDKLETEMGKWTDASIAADVADCAKSLTELAASNRQVAALLVELFELMEDETSGTDVGSSDTETDDPL